MASVRGNSGGTYDLARGLRLYEGDGPLAERAAELWRHIAPAELDLARDFWRRYRQSEEVTDSISDEKVEELAKRILPYLRDKFERIASPQWVETARNYVEKALANRVSLSTLLAGVSAETETAFTALRAAVADGPDLVRLCRTLSDVEMVEIDVFVHHAMQITRTEVDARQAQQADNFNQKVLGVVQRCTAESEQLRAQATTTSSAARGMLGKTSEVAAAAEQSATAMREAAQTAAGLIRAIEDARSEVEVAAGVATRAGDAGRGFAVVAQEVKSLASQTARATDDITAKITAIQQATRETVEANSSIKDTVEEVETSADRIRQAMELQAQTVTMITAAVDETALAADSMSSTIAAIRSDTENVAKDIDNVEQGFGRFSEQIADFRSATSEFVSKFAA